MHHQPMAASSGWPRLLVATNLQNLRLTIPDTGPLPSPSTWLPGMALGVRERLSRSRSKRLENVIENKQW